eukprot:scaffold71729_cov61-Phaeocystis_antarctica.AAC.2
MELERARGRSDLSDGEVAHFLQQQDDVVEGGFRANFLQQQDEVFDGGFRTRMPPAERLAPPLHRLAEQRLGGGEVAFVLHQKAEAVD